MGRGGYRRVGSTFNIRQPSPDPRSGAAGVLSDQTMRPAAPCFHTGRRFGWLTHASGGTAAGISTRVMFGPRIRAKDAPDSRRTPPCLPTVSDGARLHA